MSGIIFVWRQAYAGAVPRIDTTVGMGGNCTVHVDVAVAG